MSAVLLDLDGTLVDSVYHHVEAWDQALRSHGEILPRWRIHRAIGLGSDRLIPWLLGHHPDTADAMSDEHDRRFLEMAEDLHATRGASQLIDDLEARAVPFLVATSAGGEEREALLAALGRTDLSATDADDVATSKPDPEIVIAACRELGVEPGEVVMVGDTPWDAEAARRAGARAIGVRTGGFGADELTGSGASAVVDAPADLIGRL